jgi:hypothetical protein
MLKLTEDQKMLIKAQIKDSVSGLVVFLLTVAAIAGAYGLFEISQF